MPATRYTSLEITEASERIPITGWYVHDKEAEGDHELASKLIDGPYDSEDDCNKQRDKLKNN